MRCCLLACIFLISCISQQVKTKPVLSKKSSYLNQKISDLLKQVEADKAKQDNYISDHAYLKFFKNYGYILSISLRDDPFYEIEYLCIRKIKNIFDTDVYVKPGKVDYLNHP